MPDIQCEICSTIYPVPRWREGSCPKCGAYYEWVEDYVLVQGKPCETCVHKSIYRDESFCLNCVHNVQAKSHYVSSSKEPKV